MIECLKFKPIAKGALIGYADLYIEKMGIEIYGCAVFQSGNRKWLSMPSREYKDPQGATKYLSIVRFRDKNHMDAFSDAAIQAIDQFRAQQPQVVPMAHGAYGMPDENIPF
jgi:hypothetical protein